MRKVRDKNEDETEHEQMQIQKEVVDIFDKETERSYSCEMTIATNLPRNDDVDRVACAPSKWVKFVLFFLLNNEFCILINFNYLSF